eukprot:TRINITY_DN1574_c0_g1_i4.p1 TRINITY_DN1574_c0_g1~~TRINITY_DN1574_c0_g1_i4.p1  ORF type:complete len:436 (+),score=58.13 TRINITY_DN1574_c0_g1_i4:108-1415(+)
MTAFVWRHLYSLSLLCRVAAVRVAEEKNDVEGLHNATSRGYPLPRPCNALSNFKQKLNGGENCCVCDPNSGSAYFNEIDQKLDTCAWSDGRTQLSKMCCPAWAVDCEPGDYAYEKGLREDVPLIDQLTCDDNECADVAKLHRAAKQELSKYAKAAAPEASLSVIDIYVTGLSNKHTSGRQYRVKACSDCTCGELVEKEAMLCKETEESLWCPSDDRACCTSLDDCNATDPWPQKVNEERENAKAKARMAQDAQMAGDRHGAQDDVLSSADLLTVCRSECVAKRKKEWMAALHRNKRQVEDKQRYFDFRYAYIQRKDEESKADLEHFNQQIEEKWIPPARKEQVMTVTNWQINNGRKGPEDLCAPQWECCLCMMADPAPVDVKRKIIADFCYAPGMANNCSSYRTVVGGAACKAVDKGRCGKNCHECSGDVDFYAR